MDLYLSTLLLINTSEVHQLQQDVDFIMFDYLHITAATRYTKIVNFAITFVQSMIFASATIGYIYVPKSYS